MRVKNSQEIKKEKRILCRNRTLKNLNKKVSRYCIEKIPRLYFYYSKDEGSIWH